MNKKAAAFINSEIDRLAEKILSLQRLRQPELNERYDARSKKLCLQDVKYHLSYLGEALEVSSLSLFLDYMVWVKDLLSNLKLPPQDLIVNVECIKEVLIEETPAGCAEVITPYIDAALEKLKIQTVRRQSFLDIEAPHHELAGKYINFLINGDKNQANQLIQDAFKNGVSVRDLYLYVFQKTQRELGRLWHENKITVACEHYCTAATQLILSQLYPYIFSASKNSENKKYNIVIACVSNELHEMGIRMVADFLELEGFNTYYLGANVPQKSIIQTIYEKKANVLALSTTISTHVKYTAAIIEEIKGSHAVAGVKVIVGGYPFNVDEDLWKKIGAHGYAADMSCAVEKVSSLIGSKENQIYGIK